MRQQRGGTGSETTARSPAVAPIPAALCSERQRVTLDEPACQAGGWLPAGVQAASAGCGRARLAHHAATAPDGLFWSDWCNPVLTVSAPAAGTC